MVVVFSLIVVFYAFKLLAPMILNTIQGSIATFIGYSSTIDYITPSDTGMFFVEGAKVFLMTALPLLLITGLVAVVLTVFQTRLLVTTESLKPKFDRINPIQGFKRMFSLRGVVELLKSLLKITVLGYIIYTTLRDEIAFIPRMIDMSLMESLSYTGEIIFSIVQTAVVIMAFVAGFDYFYQWYEYEKNLRMSKQEIKEEYKQTEGDPQIKGKIRERQQQASRRRMMQSVPSADVIIRNPTHYAVAIKYDPKKNIAPVVIAKGADAVALRIIAIAEEHDIIITENRPLARGLFETVDLEQAIPEQFYQPVAEVLAFVYSLKKKGLDHEIIQ